MKNKEIKFTKSELSHILSLISQREQDGWYYAPKKQFEEREGRIAGKILTMFKEAK